MKEITKAEVVEVMRDIAGILRKSNECTVDLSFGEIAKQLKVNHPEKYGQYHNSMLIILIFKAVKLDRNMTQEAS